MAGRSEDPNKLVNVACKVPTYIRDKFAGIALLKGDIKVSRRLERLIMADVRENASRPFSPILNKATFGMDSTRPLAKEPGPIVACPEHNQDANEEDATVDQDSPQTAF